MRAQRSGSLEQENCMQRGQLTFAAEGIADPGSPYFSRRLHWPGGASGVTIGRGYDMKLRSATQIEHDLRSAGVSTRVARQYAQAAGLRGTPAREFVRRNRSTIPELTAQQERRLFDAVYAAYEQRTQALVEREMSGANAVSGAWEMLHPAIREVLVDLCYRGDLTSAARNRLRDAVMMNSVEALYQLVADRSQWGSSLDANRFQLRKAVLEEGAVLCKTKAPLQPR